MYDRLLIVATSDIELAKPTGQRALIEDRANAHRDRIGEAFADDSAQHPAANCIAEHRADVSEMLQRAEVETLELASSASQGPINRHGLFTPSDEYEARRDHGLTHGR